MLFLSFFLASCPAALRNKISWGWTVLKGQTRDREVHFDSSQVKFGSNVLPTQQDLSAKTSQSEEWREYRSNKVCTSVTERETVEKQQLAAIYEQRVFVVIKITAGLDCRHSCLLNSWRCFDCNYNKWWKLQHDDFKFSSMVDENSGDRWSHAGSSWRGHEAIHPVIVQTFHSEPKMSITDIIRIYPLRSQTRSDYAYMQKHGAVNNEYMGSRWWRVWY